MTTYSNLSVNLNLSSLSDILIQANTNTSGTFWTGMYFMIMAVIFLSSIAVGFEVAMLMTFFGSMIIGIFLVYLGLINMTIFGMSEAILIFIVIYLMYSSRSNP